MKKQFKLTTEGIAELEAEIKVLVANRGELADRIKSAREFGDLAENAEYSSARQDQERAEGRITEIDHILKKRRSHQAIQQKRRSFFRHYSSAKKCKR